MKKRQYKELNKQIGSYGPSFKQNLSQAGAHITKLNDSVDLNKESAAFMSEAQTDINDHNLQIAIKSLELSFWRKAFETYYAAANSSLKIADLGIRALN